MKWRLPDLCLIMSRAQITFLAEKIFRENSKMWIFIQFFSGNGREVKTTSKVKVDQSGIRFDQKKKHNGPINTYHSFFITWSWGPLFFAVLAFRWTEIWIPANEISEGHICFLTVELQTSVSIRYLVRNSTIRNCDPKLQGRCNL